MRNMFLVIKHEIKTTLAKRSFWLTTFLFPLMIVAFTVLPQVMAEDAATGEDPALALGAPAIGYVDQAGVIESLPPDLPPGLLVALADEAAAQAALEDGQVGRYYVIPQDFVASGQLTLVDGQFSPMTGPIGSNLMEYVVNSNLVDDPALARLLIDPMPAMETRVLAPATGEASSESALDFAVPFAVMFILFFTITMSGGYMLQSVAKEKENRTAEVLLLSLRPLELMAGKVVGLGALALMQMAIWTGGGMLVLDRGQSLLATAGDYELPAGFMVWTLFFFLLGYLLYASALGAVGALAPNVREGSQFTFAIILPLLVPLWLNSVFFEAPDGPLATFLSLFPLTSPTAMVTRLVAGQVPAWQPPLALLGLAVTAVLFVLLSARFFRADTLLSDNSLNWRRILGELRG